ncbi:GNAT family N-acetyltransferase [Streptomyces sp. NPDC056390]|uniref:GNAT family N-acetyltransferase n=1 Tax=Streptomyces sp. NPDC056390 TaxID=3345806 RepID=UPI0035E1B31E
MSPWPPPLRGAPCSAGCDRRFSVREAGSSAGPESGWWPWEVQEHLAADPAGARSGVGAALVEAVREVGRRAGCRRLVASVWEFNAAARPFYEAIGLRPVQVRMDQPL